MVARRVIDAMMADCAKLNAAMRAANKSRL